ncbi:MAG: hypothetical protein KKF98_08015 [Bacteroidetes bacterium]|nr:hypothetical protein [Bacteroidota bacterium]
MKKIIITSIILFTAVIFFNKLSAQNPIPAFNVPVIVDPTVFEEAVLPTGVYLNQIDNLSRQPENIEERKLKVNVQPDDDKEIIWVIFSVYSLDQQTIYGPFTVYEGEIHETTIDERQWGVKVLNSSPGCRLSVWID